MKKICSVILAFVICISSCLVVWADSSVTIKYTPSKSTVEPGDTFTVILKIENMGNASSIGINAPIYDKTSLEWTGGEWTFGSSPVLSDFDIPGEIGVAAFTDDMSMNGDIAVLSFRVLPTATNGTKTISFSVVANNLSNANQANGATVNTASITIENGIAEFVPVTNVSNVPTGATTGVDLALTGVVAPANATNKNISWSISTANQLTGATVENGKLKTTTAGTAVVTATIVNGTSITENYTKDFSITVTDPVNAETPNITVHPQGTTYTKNAIATALSVTASVIDGGTLSYEWFRNSTDSTTDGTSAATTEKYTPPTTTVGTSYYYVVVTNTNNSVNGTKTATATSNTACIIVNELVNAVTPTITVQPQGAIYTRSESATALSVTANVTDNGTLSYEWFSNSTNSNTGGTSVATTEKYTPPTTTLGTTYYYVVVTNTNNSVNGAKTATATSNTAKIEVVSATHIISFDSDGGGTLNNITVSEGSTYGTLPTPTKAGYKFDGWYTQTTGGDKIESTTTVSLGDTSTTQTLYAHWTEKATITINEAVQNYTYDGNVKAFSVIVTSVGTPAPTQASFSVSYSTANPTNAGSYNVTVTRPEDDNYKAFTKTITNGLVIDPIEITSITDLPTASSIKIGQALSSSTLTGGDNRFTYAWTDSTITPPLGTSPQSVTVTLKNTQNYSYTGSNPISVNITVSAYTPPTITTTSLSNGTVNNPYSQTITATGESGYPITFTLDSGDLPTGLTLNTNGTISGTPTVVDTYTFTVKATNIGGSDTKTYTIEINEIPKLATPTNVTLVNGVASWTAVPNATSYKVVLYKDGQEITTVSTTSTAYNFTSVMKVEGDYTVTVQAIGNGVTGVDSDVSVESTPYHHTPSAPITNETNIAYWIWIQQQLITNQTYKIKATAEKGGTISPEGTVEVKAGNNQQFTITANDGYKISDVTIDGESIGVVETYKFKNVYAGHTIKATFEKIPEPVEEKNTPKEQAPEKEVTQVEPEWENPFKDISKTDSYYEAVKYVYENSLFKGTAEDTFDPDVTMNRAMFVTVLGRYFNVDVSEYTKADTMFDDVEADQWYTPYIQWAYESGLIYGYGDGRFGTLDIISHEHMYLIMDRFLEMIGVDYTFEYDEAIDKDEVKRYEVAELLYELYTEIGE